MIAVSVNFQKELTLLGEGYYEQLMEEGISNISIDIYSTLKDHTFCTARQDHLNIFSKDIARGPDLSKANDDAAERLFREHGREMITRLFIFDGWSDTSKHYALMRNQKEHHVDVRVIFLHQIRTAGIADHNLDFGIWDNRLVMKITGSNKIPRLVVSTKAHELDRANEIRAELNKHAVSWEKFNNDLREPMNLNWGNFAAEKRLLRLPPPNGPGEKDLKVVLDQVKPALAHQNKPSRLAILGLTGPILDEIAAFRESSKANLDVECVDIRAEPGEREKVRYVCKNWLEWMPGANFDAVIGDDILCNLRIWQIPLLFEKLNGALGINGMFVVRTTINPGLSAGIDPDSMGDLLREKREALEAVWGGPDAASAARKQERETAAYELAWPLLHHAKFYDSTTNEFDLGRWNLWLNQELRHTPADSAYKLHLDLKYQVRITSILESDLRSIAEQHGFEVATNEVQSIWESDLRYRAIDPDGVIASRFKEHYKIFTFRKIGSL